MKVFISQPMNGKDEQTILEERAKMVSRIKEQYPDAEILESYFEDYNPSTGNVGLKYLSKSLELLADADEAWFAPGWQNARGCRIENDCAIAYGITIHEIYYDMNEDMPKQMVEDDVACIHQLENHTGELTEKVVQLGKAHDALIADFGDADMIECVNCAHYVRAAAQCKGGDCFECDCKNCVCNKCWDKSNWVWRGVGEGEHVREF